MQRNLVTGCTGEEQEYLWYILYNIHVYNISNTYYIITHLVKCIPRLSAPSTYVIIDFLQCIYFSTSVRTYLKTSLTGSRLWIFSSIFGKRIQRTEVRSWHLCIDGRGAVQCGGRYGWAQCGLLLQWQRQQKQQQQWQRQLHHHHHDRKKRLRNVCCLLLIMKRKQKRNRVYGNWKSYSVFSIGNWKKAAAVAEWMVCARPGPSLNWVFDGCATISSVFIFCFALFMSCLFTWLHFTLVYCFNLNARLAIGTHSHSHTHATVGHSLDCLNSWC